ncbi:MAG TPA: CapA family protein [Streptosporangiaceae bacterium]|jgi:poly-gamma-glutamate capsule biosynthesis protein CapA/YwtB (metallophosphatase superfamily)
MRRTLGVSAGAGVLLALAACGTYARPVGSSTIESAPLSGASVSASASPSPRARGVSPSPGASPDGSVTIAVVGDTMLGDTPDLPPDPATYFDAVKPTLDAGAQIVFGNLEGTLTTATASKCGPAGPSADCFAFKIPPGYVQYLKAAGFTVLNDANNHIFDFGAAGQAQTVSTIHAAGLAQTGLPGEITVVKASGIKVAFLAFAPYDYDASLLDLPAAEDLIEQARHEASIVVVYMHAGAEGATADHVTGQEEYYLGEDRGNPEAFAHMAINAGASLVIASGPHVVRGMQFYDGHLIAYSVGNFAGYNDFATNGDLDMSVILHVTLSSSGQFDSARIYPIQFTPQGQPQPGGAAVPFVTQLSTEDFGSTAAHFTPTGTITAP